jgi:hypothetical protein
VDRVDFTRAPLDHLLTEKFGVTENMLISSQIDDYCDAIRVSWLTIHADLDQYEFLFDRPEFKPA